MDLHPHICHINFAGTPQKLIPQSQMHMLTIRLCMRVALDMAKLLLQRTPSSNIVNDEYNILGVIAIFLPEDIDPPNMMCIRLHADSDRHKGISWYM